MKSERILDVLGLVDEKFILEASPEQQRPSRYSCPKGFLLAACLCLIIGIFTFPLMRRDPAAQDTEPYIALSEKEALSYAPYGSLLPQKILDGYALENDVVGLYGKDKKVMKATYRNADTGDVFTVTIASGEYFGEVELNTVLYPDTILPGSRIYLATGDFITLYSFESRDIADIPEFDEMAASAAQKPEP